MTPIDTTSINLETIKKADCDIIDDEVQIKATTGY